MEDRKTPHRCYSSVWSFTFARWEYFLEVSLLVNERSVHHLDQVHS